MPEGRKKKHSKKGGCPYGAGTTGAARHRKKVAMEAKRKSRSKSHSKKSRSKKSKSKSRTKH